MVKLSLFLAFVSTVCVTGVTIKEAELKIINSETKPGNLLPNFLFQQGSIEGGSVGVKIGGGRGTPRSFAPDDSCGDGGSRSINLGYR